MPDRYFFGRVIATDTTIGNITEIGVVMIYLYRVTSSSKEDIPELKPTELLVPPLGTNTLAWTRGFFEVIKSGINSANDLLPTHCFRNGRGNYIDEYGNSLPGPIEPVGFYGLAGIGAIDDDISKALGLPIKEAI